MASRDYLRHLVSNNAPAGTRVGDEYYDPISNKLFKTLVVNGTTVSQVEVLLTPANNTITAAFTSANNRVLKTGDTMTGNLVIVGTLSATTKSFVIKHPLKEGMQLRYGSLEGPENGVYVRGQLEGTTTIELPDYWVKLIDPNSITVQLSSIGNYQKLFVENIVNNTVTIGIEDNTVDKLKCFYTIFAERVDVSKLQVEI
jgi:hypothetical protein